MTSVPDAAPSDAPSLVVVVPDHEGGARLRLLDEDVTPLAPVERVVDLPARVAELEKAHAPRWVWADTGGIYAGLLRSGVRVERCHDLTLVEAILLGYHGAHNQPRGLAAAWARSQGLPPPPDLPTHTRGEQPTLFIPEPPPLPGGAEPIDAATTVLAEQHRGIAATAHPGRLRLLAAAESAGALVAAEMTHYGLPWREDVHRRLLVELVGERPSPGQRPRKLAVLAERIARAFGDREVNPDHPGSVLRAFAREGIDLPSTRAQVLRGIAHPAVAPLLEYKELSRLWVANGWTWLDTWVHNGRFRADYVVGGVVSGRWATRGGAALQLPKATRFAVQADQGWTFVAADAAQLEPRVLAALSRDRRLAELTAAGDLYTGLATDSFDDDRGQAKIAMLSAMYGGTAGGAGSLLAVLRRRFPDAVDYVEHAAAEGEAGRAVRSTLGRTSPPPSEGWRELTASPDLSLEHRSRQAAREWGRFTRNFVIQASAADWALALLAALRRRLAATVAEAELVFFLHDEILVHCPLATAKQVLAQVAAAAEEATSLVFPGTPVRFPLPAKVVRRYSDAK
ncbi:MAG: bifunctional 3'-5' exonuclease/DNA polymerase [Sciscionella sp.]